MDTRGGATRLVVTMHLPPSFIDWLAMSVRIGGERPVTPSRFLAPGTDLWSACGSSSTFRNGCRTTSIPGQLPVFRGRDGDSTRVSFQVAPGCRFSGVS